MVKPKAKFINIIIATALVLCTLTGCEAPSPYNAENGSSKAESSQISDPQKAETPKTEKLMESIYYDRDIFYRSINDPEKYTIEGKLVGGMVPHHLVAGDMITGFFELAAKQTVEYDTVLLVAPNHYPENCTSDVLTTTANWNTTNGIIKNDVEISQKLIDNKIISPESSAKNVEFDHAVGGLTPFIKHYLPNAKLSVCLISNKVFEERLEEIWKFVAEEATKKNVLVLASVDCSHYLTPQKAEIKDKETIEAIASYDYNRLMKFSDSNIDSPQSVTTLLKAMEKQNAKLYHLGQGSSETKLPHSLDNPIYDEGVTTYLTYAFTVPNGTTNQASNNIDKLEETYVKRMARDIVNKITNPTMSEVGKIKAAYDYIIGSTYFADPIGLDAWQLEGDTEPPDYIEQSALSVLAYGIGSCEDYAAAMVVLLEAMGFEAMYVPGLTLSVQNEYVDHAWTAVKMSDGWYHIDPQLEDNITKGTLIYRYFLKGDSEMARHHIWGEGLIEYAKDLSEEQKAEIRESYIVPDCNRNYTQQEAISMRENLPTDTRKILDSLQQRRIEYEKTNGKLPSVKINKTPPVFGHEGYGPPD